MEKASEIIQMLLTGAIATRNTSQPKEQSYWQGHVDALEQAKLSVELRERKNVQN